MNMSPFQTKHARRSAYRRAVCGAFALAAVVQLCAPATAAPAPRDVSPEVVSRVWMDDDNQVAAVYVNGKELVAFRSRTAGACASDQAEDLAVRLQELVNKKDFDINQLIPTRDGDKVAIKLDNATIFAFDGGKDADDDDDEFIEAGVKIVNALRAQYGVGALPQDFAGAPPTDVAAAPGASRFSGHASWYGPRFHGRRCSDGSRFDMNGLSAAHRTLPFGTKLLVMNRRTGASVVVEVKDRGPFIAGRVIDLSKGAAGKLNMLGSGVAMVECVVLGNK